MNPFLYYIPIKEEEINNINNLITIIQGEDLKKNSDSQSSLNIKFHYKNDNKKLYSKNISIKIDINKLNKYDINSINKNKIDKEIKNSSS